MNEMISKHGHAPNDYLKLFLFTFEEYQKVTSVFEEEKTSLEQEYAVIQIKLTLLRKYETRADAVYLKNIVKACEILYPLEQDILRNIISEFNKLETDETELILSDGTTRTYRDAMEDIMYGVFLHADKNRCEYIMKTDLGMYLFLAKKYVTRLEKLLNQLYKKIIYLGAERFKQSNTNKASVIFAGTDSSQEKQISSDSYWSNLRGCNLSDKEIEKHIENISVQDKEVLLIATMFVTELRRDELSISNLQKLVFPPTRSDWGDFSIVQEMIRNIDIGYSLKVRYHEKGDMAFVRIFKNLSVGIMINQPHYSPDIATITLVHDNDKLGWRVYAIGDEPDYYKQSGSIKDYIKYLFSNK